MSRKQARFQVGNYPPGRLPFGFQSNTPTGKNIPRVPKGVVYRPSMGKGPMTMTQERTSIVTPAPNRGGNGNRARMSSKFVGMSDMLGNQPFSVNVAYGKTMQSKMAKLQADANSCVVSHRELLLPTLNGSSSYQVQLSQNINPGLSAFSQWLSAIAADYEEYEILEFGLEYITRSPSNTKGSIGICFDYDPSDPAPASELEASQMNGTMESNVWKDFVILGNVNNMKGNMRRKFIRSGPSLGDIKNFDSGSFSIYTNDCVDSSPIGKIWMFYKVRLMTPQSPIQPAVPPATCSYFRSLGNQSVTSAVDAYVEFDSTDFNPLQIALDSTFKVFTPPRGAFKIDVRGCVSTDTAGVVQATLSIQKNGASQGAICLSKSTLPASGIAVLSATSLISCSGTDTILLDVNVSGAGALILPDNTWSVTFSIC